MSELFLLPTHQITNLTDNVNVSHNWTRILVQLCARVITIKTGKMRENEVPFLMFFK